MQGFPLSRKTHGPPKQGVKATSPATGIQGYLCLLTLRLQLVIVTHGYWKTEMNSIDLTSPGWDDKIQTWDPGSSGGWVPEVWPSEIEEIKFSWCIFQGWRRPQNVQSNSVFFCYCVPSGTSFLLFRIFNTINTIQWKVLLKNCVEKEKETEPSAS